MAKEHDHQIPNHHGLEPKGSSSELLTQMRISEIHIWEKKEKEQQIALWKIKEKKEDLEVKKMELELNRAKQELAYQRYLPIALLLCVAAGVWMFRKSIAEGVIGAFVAIALLSFVGKIIALYVGKSSRE